MKLRDGDFDSLADFCAAEGVSEDELKARLGASGFDYLPDIRQFR